ncbi:GNAT family N-acetyltransferase [Streptomyces sp. DH12]|uniref:GNAT family N-acetyltransferase n=1 Tax=Streptomyces sp. DH12 TaxID=2857010 RepID=UPI001E5F8116|nr:GNAT family N-acetyltransferase [Streptomyces sp. DH12]
MNVIVREFRPEDAPGVTRVRRSCAPYVVVTPASVLFDVAASPPARRHRLLVAERDGEAVGWAAAGITYGSPVPGQGHASAAVHPYHRGRGVGGLLLRAVEKHLAAVGARAVHGWVADRPACRAFAERRGYRPARTMRHQRLDLAAAALPDPVAALPPGVELRTAADLAADPRPLFEADAEVVADEPTDVPVEWDDYADWLRDTWGDPLLDQRLSTVVLVDGEVAAFTAAHTDGATRYASGMTGTRRAHRGRGLATLAKADSLRRARAAGFRSAYTSNDSTNAPMLAVNRRLGYRVCATEVGHVRTLG